MGVDSAAPENIGQPEDGNDANHAPEIEFLLPDLRLSARFRAYNTGYNVGVGGAVVHRGKLLMVRRASKYGRGNWQIPGGFIERDETLEQAVVREVAEESGVTARVRGVLGLRSRVDEFNSTYIVFLLAYCAGEPAPDGVETDRAEWISLDDLAGLEKLPAINATIAMIALSQSPPALGPQVLPSVDGTEYTLFAGSEQ